MLRSVIKGTGSALPKNCVTNKDLEKKVDTSDEWIVQRTGIKQRYICGEGESTLTLSVDASRKALEAANCNPSDIDGIIVATTTPDNTFPSVAVQVQAALDVPECMAFDVQAVCSGFVYALSVADKILKSGSHKRMLVIGAETMSRILDWNDRTTCVLFGDGAGAVVLEASEESGDEDRGVISTHLHADGRLKNILYTDGGAGTTSESGYIKMQGRDVFKHAVTNMHDVVAETLQHNKIDPSEIDWLVPHQANIRIITATADKLGMSMDKVVLTVAQHGNTSAASIPLALDYAVRRGDIKQGDLLLLEALGAGLTWGAALIRF